MFRVDMGVSESTRTYMLLIRRRAGFEDYGCKMYADTKKAHQNGGLPAMICNRSIILLNLVKSLRRPVCLPLKSLFQRLLPALLLLVPKRRHGRIL